VRAHFFELCERLAQELRGGEVLLCSLRAERSDFVRFNRASVRQAGSVEQRAASLRLVKAGRQAAATLTVAGTREDLESARRALGRVREALAGLPEDPWLLINQTPQSTCLERRGTLAPAQAVVSQAGAAAQGLDLVGFYAGGTICRGFASSLGQRNWHEIDSFNFDWSLHRGPRQAVKAAYAGHDWDGDELGERMQAAAGQLALLGLPERQLPPGEYRAYLAPRAMEELLGLLSWSGFSARSRATRQSPLLRMQEGERLSSEVTLTESTAQGIAPGFQAEGFVKPAAVTLIDKGRLGEALASPRSAKEYGLAGNAASAGESPESLDMAGGGLEERDALRVLDTGLYLSNLWYLNYSDRPAGRITGMTRFATFWVQGGKIVAPVGAMRFDDSIYRILGKNLAALTRSRELLLDPSTYAERSTSSARLPGALLSALRFTL
jgi:predicted Zn-dependent protease